MLSNAATHLSESACRLPMGCFAPVRGLAMTVG